MDEKNVLINDKLIAIEDIIEISDFLNENQSNNFPFGFSIVLKDNSIINAICEPNCKQRESKQKELITTYQTIQKKLLNKYKEE